MACSTCRLSATVREGADGRRGGAMLADALERVRASDPAYAAVSVARMPCLFACGDHCTVHLRGENRIGYVLGRFEPDEAAARAILDYARHYAESAGGQVPFRDWPDGVKGHFIVRTPPPGRLVE